MNNLLPRIKPNRLWMDWVKKNYENLTKRNWSNLIKLDPRFDQNQSEPAWEHLWA